LRSISHATAYKNDAAKPRTKKRKLLEVLRIAPKLFLNREVLADAVTAILKIRLEATACAMQHMP